MRVARYLTHPQVRIDPAVPVPRWSLNDEGRRRVEALACAGRLDGTRRIVASGETKATETAAILAHALGLRVEVREAMHENDRSATGFLPPERFEAMADAFFARPEESVAGWERAADAQARIVREAETVLAAPGEGDVLFVGHGAVGTLLMCHYAGWPIDRRHDQPAGGGNLFALAIDGRQWRHGWMPIEDWVAQR